MLEASRQRYRNAVEGQLPAQGQVDDGPGADAGDWAEVAADEPLLVANPRTCEWLPSFTRPRSEASIERLIVATDASSGPTGATTAAAVTADGGLALESSAVDVIVSEAELNAISLALETFGLRVTDELCVLSDSVDAVIVARALAYDRVPDEGFRGISDDALDRFEDAWDRLPCVARFFHVKGHVGHPLNEAADELAVIGRLAAGHPRADVESELDQRAAAVSDAVIACSDDQLSVPEQSHSAGEGSGLSWSIAERLVSRRVS